MEEIGKIFPSIFKKHVQGRQPRVVEILAPLWPRVAGKAMARQSQPVAFGAGTLTLATACPSWATELRRMAEEIRAQVNSFLGGPVVKRLRVRYTPELEIRKSEFETGNSKFENRSWEPDFEFPRIDPEVARILEQSFTKYFSRPGIRNRKPGDLKITNLKSPIQNHKSQI